MGPFPQSTAAAFALLVAALPLFGVEPALSSTTPQPRVRLPQTAHSVDAAVDARDKTPAGTEAVMMDRMVVGTSPLPARPTAVEPREFSLLFGGPVVQQKMGHYPVALGLWSAAEAFSEEARFKPQKTRADFEVVRVKW
ncbi:MAG: hypothetical protein RIQ93_783 [Verrucomicrobiota bacterium]